VLAPERLRQGHGGDELAGLQGGIDLGPVTGQAVELGHGDAARVAPGVDGLHGGVEDAHGHRHVAGMGRDAGLARTDDRELTRDARDGAAA